jgi:hypothetical protein
MTNQTPFRVTKAGVVMASFRVLADADMYVVDKIIDVSRPRHSMLRGSEFRIVRDDAYGKEFVMISYHLSKEDDIIRKAGEDGAVMTQGDVLNTSFTLESFDRDRK